MRDDRDTHDGNPGDVLARLTLSRRSALTGLATAAVATPIAALPMLSAHAGPLAYNLQPIKIADGVWMLEGAHEAVSRDNGGNIVNVGILDTTDGAVVIDTGPSKRYGQQLAKLATELTGKPVVRALVTHFHPDHVFGNQAFAPNVLATAQGVADGLKTTGEDFATAMYYLAGDWMRGTAVALPQTIVTDGHEDIGERRLQYRVRAGHTDSDLVVFDEASGTLFAGDLLFLNRAPTTPHANLPAWRASLDALAAIEFKAAVPGHGPADTTKQAISQTRDWLAMAEDAIRGAFERGLSMTEAMAVPLPVWTDTIALARYEFQRSVMHLYPGLEDGTWPRVDKS